MINKILKWETEYRLFEKGNIRGFDFYSYMRRELINTCLNRLNDIEADPFEAKGQVDTGLKLFLKLLKRSEKTNMSNVDLLILCHSRRNLSGDKYESVFTDFLENHFPNSLTLERHFTNHSHFEPAGTKNLCYVDRIVLKSYIYRLLVKTFKKTEYSKLWDEIRYIMEEPLRTLERELGVKVNRRRYYSQAVILYYFYRSRKRDYIRFIKKVKPKLLVEVVGKSFDAMVINEVCDELGIPTVELQHCLLGVTALYPDGIFVKQFADYYLTYSDYWKDYAKYPINDDRVISAGSPYFERQVKKYKGTAKKHDKKSVLFISGIAYGKELSKVACELKKAAGDEMDIIYKLHPDEFKCYRELYPELIENDITVIDSKDVSIYEFFDGADAQVGVFSTALYEGLAFNVDTYILDIPFAREFKDFCNQGYGTLITDGEQLYKLVKSSGASNDNAAISERFWKSDAEKNIVDEIRKLIKNS